MVKLTTLDQKVERVSRDDSLQKLRISACPSEPHPNFLCAGLSPAHTPAPHCGPHHHSVPITATSTQPVCSPVLAHSSVIQNTLISSAFKELLVPTHYLSDKSEFFLCGSMGFCIFTGHVYTLCYSHTFLTSHKNFNSSKRTLGAFCIPTLFRTGFLTLYT